MNEDCLQARAVLEAEGCTCVLCGQGRIYKRFDRGIRPLLTFLDEGPLVAGFCAADKVVGKAAALLYCLLQVQEVYAPVISKPALEVLENHGIRVYYQVCTPAIQNRAGNGLCPMETATQAISDPRLAPALIREALEKLQRS